MARGKRRYKTVEAGEDFVASYKLHRWVVQCVLCQRQGYDPAVADDERNRSIAYSVRLWFRPLSLTGGMCEDCLA